MKLSHIFLLCISLLSFQAHAMEPLDEGRPNEHICPILHQTMRSPVVAADGHSYEKDAITQYLEGTKCPISPATGLPLSNKDLIENKALKIMINEWKPSIQGEPSVLKTRSAGDIAQLIREEFKKNEVLLNAARDKHIVAFLGNTGAGKSTLVNLLAGKNLIVSQDGEDYILEDPNDNTAMAIGTEGSSETLYPKFIDIDGLRFFDLPGFNDTDGSERNLVNAAFIRKILLDATSVRLVLVAGQDQFTADRSASVKGLLNSLRQFFVVGQGGGLIDCSSVFVATKVTCPLNTEITEFLVKKTSSHDKEELKTQLKYWCMRDRLSCVFHPLREENTEVAGKKILDLIKDTEGEKVRGVNVSALYPSDTQHDLERMFLNVLEEGLARKLKSHPVTLSEYDRSISYYEAKDFWQQFERETCVKDGAVAILKDFCAIPYHKALKKLEQNSKEDLKIHIRKLKSHRQKRVQNIEERTEEKARALIASLVPVQLGNDFISFDFAYHKDFYDEVCGPQAIVHLATDSLEQDIVRRHYAGFISQHSHHQMMDWFEKFSGMQQLIERLTAAEEKLAELEAKKEERQLEQLRSQEAQKAAENQQRLEKERLEKERLEKERLARERLEKERLEKERLARENLEKERLEKERLAREAVAEELKKAESKKRMPEKCPCCPNPGTYWNWNEILGGWLCTYCEKYATHGDPGRHQTFALVATQRQMNMSERNRFRF